MSDDNCTVYDDGVERRSRDYDQIYGVLADERRRRVLHSLVEKDIGNIEEVAEQMVEWEHSAAPVDPPDRFQEEVVISLLHVHLPKLEDVGILEYDVRSGSIRYTGDALLERHLQETRTVDVPE